MSKSAAVEKRVSDDPEWAVSDNMQLYNEEKKCDVEQELDELKSQADKIGQEIEFIQMEVSKMLNNNFGVGSDNSSVVSYTVLPHDEENIDPLLQQILFDTAEIIADLTTKNVLLENKLANHERNDSV